MERMKRCVATGFFLSLVLSAASAHAQALPEAQGLMSFVPTGLPEDGWLVLLGVGAAIVTLGLGSRLFRRGASHGQQAASKNKQADGYKKVEPVLPLPKPAGIRPMMVTASEERTDTIIAPRHVPGDFNVPRFLQKAKAAFLRLQLAWDQGDLQEIRRLTTGELYGKFCKQLAERGGIINVTTVESLEANLISIDTVGAYHVATVKFHGLSKDGDSEKAVPFLEEWQLSRPLDRHRSWTVTGIQQFQQY